MASDTLGMASDQAGIASDALEMMSESPRLRVCIFRVVSDAFEPSAHADGLECVATKIARNGVWFAPVNYEIRLPGLRICLPRL